MVKWIMAEAKVWQGKLLPVGADAPEELKGKPFTKCVGQSTISVIEDNRQELEAPNRMQKRGRKRKVQVI